MRSLAIVHGEKLLPNGEMHVSFILRLNEALRLVKKEGVDAVLITGGTTRAGLRSEADMGKTYLSTRLHVPILTENESHTTVENIIFSKRLLEAQSDFLPTYIITSKKRVTREKYLYRRLWPTAYENAKYIGTYDTYPIGYRLVELLYFVYAVFDLHEKTLGRLTKKMFRNCQHKTLDP